MTIPDLEQKKIKIYCPACTGEFEVDKYSEGDRCRNDDCQAPFEFKIFNTKEDAMNFLHEIKNCKSKNLFQPRSISDKWFVSYFNGEIQPFRVNSMFSLIHEDVLKAIQAGYADNLGGPITMWMWNLKDFREGKIKLNRIEPLECAHHEGSKTYMRNFSGFCRELRGRDYIKDGNEISGEHFCLEFDKAKVEEYLKYPPYKPQYYECWCGLIDYMVPVIVNGEIMAILFSGQKRLNDGESNQRMVEKIKKACINLGLDASDTKRMLALASEKTPKVELENVDSGIDNLLKVARGLQMVAEEKYASVRQVAENYFIEEICTMLVNLADKNYENEELLWKSTEGVLKRILEFTECFQSIAVLYETAPDSNSYYVAAGCGEITRDFKACVYPKYLDELMPGRLGPLYIDKDTRKELYDTFSEKLVSYKIHSGNVIHMLLQSGRHILLFIASAQHNCRYYAVNNFCHYKNPLGRRFLSQLGDNLSKQLDVILLIHDLKVQETVKQAFFERAAHSLSVPVTSFMYSTDRIKKKLNASVPDVQEAQNVAYRAHNMAKLLRLLVRNVLPSSKSRLEEFKLCNILSPLREACEIFRDEAIEKGIDICPLVLLSNGEVRMDPSEIDDMVNIYMNGVFSPLYKQQDFFKGKLLTKNDISISVTCGGKSDIYIEPENITQKLYDYLYGKNKANLDNHKLSISLFENKVIIPLRDFIPSYVPMVKMAKDELSWAFQNLLHNAVKYSYWTTQKSNKRFISVKCRMSGDKNYEISISNYGVGIEEDELKEGKIWERLYRGRLSGDKNRTGSGLGLSHVKEVIEKIHGGKVSASSMRLEGETYLTTFTVTLPVGN